MILIWWIFTSIFVNHFVCCCFCLLLLILRVVLCFDIKHLMENVYFIHIINIHTECLYLKHIQNIFWFYFKSFESNIFILSLNFITFTFPFELSFCLLLSFDHRLLLIRKDFYFNFWLIVVIVSAILLPEMRFLCKIQLFLFFFFFKMWMNVELMLLFIYILEWNDLIFIFGWEKGTTHEAQTCFTCTRNEQLWCRFLLCCGKKK